MRRCALPLLPLLAAAGCGQILGIADFTPAGTTPDAAPAPFTMRAFTPRLHGVAYGNGMFVAVGNAGRVLTSTDGVTWTTHTTPLGDPLVSVAFGAGVFVAARQAAAPFWSSDGVTWAAGTVPGQPGFNWVRYLNNQFVGGFSVWLRTSADGKTWSAEKVFPATWTMGQVAYGPTYMAGGASGTTYGTFTSSDLVTWTGPQTQTRPFLVLGHGGTTFLGYDSGRVFTAPDTTSFTEIPTGGELYKDVTYFGGAFYLPGKGGTIGVLTSTAVALHGAGVEDLEAIAATTGNYVAVGDAVLHSGDGSTWATVSTSSASALNDVTASDGTPGAAAFVAVGSKGRILTSLDGITFRDNGFSNEPANLTGVAYGNGAFVAVSGQGVKWFTSTTGQSWTPHTGASGASVAFGAGQFVAVSGNTFATSSNGQAWTSGTPSFTQTVNAISYAHGLFFAGAFGDTIFTSPDGNTWTPHTVSGISGRAWGQVVYAAGRFVARPLNTFDSVGVSADGQSWTALAVRLSGQPLEVRGGLTSDGTRFVFLGGAMPPYTLYTTTDFTTITSLGRLGPEDSFAMPAWAWNQTLSPIRGVGVGDQAYIVTIP